MTPFSFFVVFFLGFWLLASIIGQFEKTRPGRFFRQRDALSLIPRWSFFAPNPGVNDFHLLYRDKLDNAELGYWKEYSLVDKTRLLKTIWNPQKRSSKALSDMVQSLIKLTDKVSPTGYKTTFPYIALINFIASIPRENYARASQFMIMESYGFYSEKEPRVIFRSEFHKL